MPVVTPSAAMRRQRGVATLAIVAILFFIVALVAAYTNRNLIFEQRTSGNQWRSTLALEAAEGGIEWTLSLLNGARIRDTCTPSADDSDPSFRERYLVVGTNGVITPVPNLSFSCVADGAGGWDCHCPVNGAPVLDPPDTGGVHPAFRARFVSVGNGRPGIVGLEVNGCTRLDDLCLGFPAQAVGTEGRATVLVSLALRNALAAAPVAAVTARGSVSPSGLLRASNPDPSDPGFAILAGGVVDPPSSIELGAAPGSPVSWDSLVVDAQSLLADGLPNPLASLPGPTGTLQPDRMFASVFSTRPEVYRDQPGALVLDCATPCDGDDVRAAVKFNPGRVLWIEGDIDLDGADAIGTDSAPVILVIQGNVRLDTTVFGVLYVRQPDPDDDSVAWNAEGSGTLTGALIVEGSMSGPAGFTVVRDRNVLAALQRSTGSFVRVPGTWRDF